jgi:hypothetical protein
MNCKRCGSIIISSICWKCGEDLCKQETPYTKRFVIKDDNELDEKQLKKQNKMRVKWQRQKVNQRKRLAEVRV